MYFSWYFIAFLFGLTLLGAITATAWFFWYTALVLLSLWAWDALWTRQKMKFTVARRFANPCYQNQENRVELVFTNPTEYRFRISWKDEPPFAVQAVHPQGRLTLPPRESVAVHYDVVAPKRGRFEYGVLNLRYNGRFGLFTRQIQYPLPGEFMVYPDLTAIGAVSLSRLAPSELEGLHRRNRLGAGGELAQLREFVSGDDYRKINWKVSAHYGKPVVNEFEPEKDQSVFLLFDAGRLLFDQINSAHSRFDHVLDSAILLAYQILARGDLIGALSFHYKVDRFLPAGKGNSQMQLLIRTFYDQQAQMVESDYREAFRFWQNRVTKRSLLFVYTDLLDPVSSRELCNQLRVISRHHRVVCVLARQENLTDAMEQPIVDEKSAYLKGTALELWQERENLKQSLRGDNIKILEVNPGNIRRMVVEHYLFLKERGLF